MFIMRVKYFALVMIDSENIGEQLFKGRGFFWILGSNFFWRPESKIGHNWYWTLQTNSLKNVGGIGFLVPKWHLGKMGFWDMATLVSFWSLFGDKMANLGLIDFKLGLYIKVNVKAGLNKFEVHISKHLAKMAILWHKIGQMPLLARTLIRHNSAIFHPILTFFFFNMLVFWRQIELWQ